MFLISVPVGISSLIVTLYKLLNPSFETFITKGIVSPGANVVADVFINLFTFKFTSQTVKTSSVASKY